jgi:hypothetical protein
VSYLTGDTSHFLGTPQAGEAVTLEFSYDTLATDQAAYSSDAGYFALDSLSLSIGEDRYTPSSPSLALQVPSVVNAWAINGCLITCSGDETEQISLSFFYLSTPKVLSDVLADNPWPGFAGATVQFQYFSGRFPGTNGWAIMQLDSMTPAPVPLPAAAWLMLSGLGGLGVFARKRRCLGPRISLNFSPDPMR